MNDCYRKSDRTDQNAPEIFLAVASTHDIEPKTLSCLSAEERYRADRFSRAQRSRQFLTGRFLLRKLLERVTSIAAEDHVLEVLDSGQVISPDGPAVSIAHSRNLVVCGAARIGEIGVDIEFASARRPCRKIAQQYFSRKEEEWLRLQTESRFYQLWTLKEAWLKAQGAGIGGGLDQLRCQINASLISAETNRPETFALKLYELGKAYVCSATTYVSDKNTELLRWHRNCDKLRRTSVVREVAAGRTAVRSVA